jgi:hypothetical protein
MTLPTALAAVVDLQHSHRDLLRVVDSLKPEDWSRGVPYGSWTVKDLVAHCIGDMSPSGPGLVAAGVVTHEFLEETAAAFDVRHRNQDMVDERARYTPEDLRQLLFEAHDAKIEATLRLTDSSREVLEYPVPMGPNYQIKVEDWLWYGYHDRQHADDIRRALEIDWTPATQTFIPEIDQRLPAMVRAHEGFLRAAYSVGDDAWGEQSRDVPGWTYHDILAHVSSNEVRRRTRVLAGTLGEVPAEELAAITDIDAWNRDRVEERRDWPFRRLVDEFVLGWHQIRETLSRLQPDHLDNDVTLGPNRTIKARDFLDRMSIHTSEHAAQLVPASRARRNHHGNP